MSRGVRGHTWKVRWGQVVASASRANQKETHPIPLSHHLPSVGLGWKRRFTSQGSSGFWVLFAWHVLVTGVGSFLTWKKQRILIIWEYKKNPRPFPSFCPAGGGKLVPSSLFEPREDKRRLFSTLRGKKSQCKRSEKQWLAWGLHGWVIGSGGDCGESRQEGPPKRPPWLISS